MNKHQWPHRSFTPPFTASGRAALAPAPPWHYAGWLLNIGFTFDAGNALPLVPPAIGRPTGVGCVHFADWQACTGGGDELLDPVLAQYRETIVSLHVERLDGTICTVCAGIWVDQDTSLLRGLLQGWPKKMGSTWITRCLPLDGHPAAAPLRAGTRLGASLAVKDRRVLEAHATVTGAPGRALGFLAHPAVGLVGWPDLRHPERLPEPVLVRPAIERRVESGWHDVKASLLRLTPHPSEEVGLLGDIQPSEASAGWLGITVTGARDA